MGLNKVGIGPNTAAHRDKLSKSHREEQGLSSREAQSTSQATLYCEVFMVEKEGVGGVKGGVGGGFLHPDVLRYGYTRYSKRVTPSPNKHPVI